MGVCLIPFFQGVKLDLPYFNTDPSYGHLLRPVSSRELAGRRKVRPVSLVDDGENGLSSFRGHVSESGLAQKLPEAKKSQHVFDGSMSSG